MAKINFKKEHFDKMLNLAVGMLIRNEVVTTKMGQPLNIVELLHTTTIGTLNTIRVAIGKQITSIEERDEWVETNDNQKQLDKLKAQKELVNLILGKTEIAKAEILSAIDNDDSFEVKCAKIDQIAAVTKEYFESILAQIV